MFKLSIIMISDEVFFLHPHNEIMPAHA